MPADKTVGGGDDAFNTFFSETGERGRRRDKREERPRDQVHRSSLFFTWFSDWLQDGLQISDLSCPEITKYVGRLWVQDT